MGRVIVYKVTGQAVVLSRWIRISPGYVDSNRERDLSVLLRGIPSLRNNTPVFAMPGKSFPAVLCRIG